jgi:peptidoglycan/xylan/chitin deacetylase (PgdA/CDA1 family)
VRQLLVPFAVAAAVLATCAFSPASAGAKTIVSLTFDDGAADQLIAKSLLDARGMDGTFYVNSGKVGLDDYMTWDEVATLPAAGHEVGGHTVSHRKLTEAPLDEARREVCFDRSRLVARGFDARSFAYPNGSVNEAVERIVAECGYTAARATRGLTDGSDRPASEPLVGGAPIAPFRVRAAPDVMTATTVATLQGYVT